MCIRVDRAIAHDRLSGEWWSLGGWRPNLTDERVADRFGIGRVGSRVGEDAFVRLVERARELIRAGDVYQVNLAHTLEASFTGSARSLFGALVETARPWHGAYLEFADADGAPVSIASVSPELFLRYDPLTRLATTRPMKGTRALTTSDARTELDLSPKDRAELAMIIDLMRNDLGRSCVLGSVRVDEARRIERHASAEGRGLLQATGAVSGTLRPDRTPIDLLWSAFPPGSVTGAPKVRAMQIIDELEPEPRHFYCGSIGHIGDNGSLHLNVAIRTAMISRSTLTYPVGAGIVADSDPASEWHETLAKAWPLLRLAEHA